jgi:hypothetical protein
MNLLPGFDAEGWRCQTLGLVVGYADFRAEVERAYRAGLGHALPPKERVARHWEAVDRLVALWLLGTTEGFYLGYSLGALKGVPFEAERPPSAGLFRLEGRVFPAVDAAALQEGLTRLVPSEADGATRAFLRRVIMQLAVAETAETLGREVARLPLPVAPAFRVWVPVRADALYEDAPTPRLPAHAADRVRAAVAALDGALQARVERLFQATSATLSGAVVELFD